MTRATWAPALELLSLVRLVPAAVRAALANRRMLEWVGGGSHDPGTWEVRVECEAAHMLLMGGERVCNITCPPMDGKGEGEVVHVPPMGGEGV